MPAKVTASTVRLLVFALMVVVGMGYLAWRVYDLPVDEHSAGRVAVRATDTVVRAGGGDARMCGAMREVSAPDEAEASVKRCTEIASRAGSAGPGWLGTSGLKATEIDVGRHSGSVTVSGSLLTAGPTFPLRVTWPLERVDGDWAISGAPDVEVG